jgi:hypothetical protein
MPTGSFGSHFHAWTRTSRHAACWLGADFHGHLIEGISERLADTVPERYVVRGGERAYLEVVEEEEIRRHPFIRDVRASAPRRRQKSGKRNDGAAVAERESAIEPSIMRALNLNHVKSTTARYRPLAIALRRFALSVRRARASGSGNSGDTLRAMRSYSRAANSRAL